MSILRKVSHRKGSEVQEMTEIEAMGYTTEDAEKVEEVIRDLARKAGVTADEAADAVYKVLRELSLIGELLVKNKEDD